MSGPPTLQVDVWSDTACPWCYVGVLRYKKALAKLNTKVASKARIATKYHSYMIDPATDPKGEEYTAYNQRRWGSDNWTKGLRASGKPAGANFGNWQWWPSTLKAHKLLVLADQLDPPKSAEATDALFAATYEEGKNVSDDAEIEKIAQQLGVDAAEVLSSEQLEEAVLASDRHAKRDLEIHGVPYFSVGTGKGRTVLRGAQSVEDIERVLDRQISKLTAQR